MTGKSLTVQSNDILARLFFKLALAQLKKFSSGEHQLPSRYCIQNLRKAAERGHLEANSQLGCLLLHHGATRTDKRIGIEYVVAAAKRGDADAQYELARAYRLGLELYSKNDLAAVHWYTLSAENGNKSAARCLAEAYSVGDLGVLKNKDKAQRWLDLAHVS